VEKLDKEDFAKFFIFGASFPFKIGLVLKGKIYESRFCFLFFDLDSEGVFLVSCRFSTVDFDISASEAW